MSLIHLGNLTSEVPYKLCRIIRLLWDGLDNYLAHAATRVLGCEMSHPSRSHVQPRPCSVEIESPEPIGTIDSATLLRLAFLIGEISQWEQ